ncbi:serine/threonine protein kinase [Myxococcus llanfairpwllgwyngyllgogerychwyrndrobwllllantysiliogogogochensis]|uniref:Serine/threonine protein kinase n=1 Tax=Myxococcus llanfairpwllgwyngyllgogerychwyrndrobwllllantysiliogogogochensis TaxID=2590453 RepID=A0A540WWX8_9BACT|nr:serine/threonine-protein kinase [Myxococcus llanfairpwllgwyngyllgogerychwyrndrobwllllantysiliogogogochensis]TQF13450.1 serine/threonine protein kinase [Myxococcus llanfairpwllgwyngyllgogerychwyrndrobwllllantysiliogogogochensis]
MLQTSLQSGQCRFRVVRHLGTGGLGRVDEIRIIESLNPSLPQGARFARKQLNEQWAREPTAKKRLAREIAALRQMEHPNIITLRGVSVFGGKDLFYVMDLCHQSSRDLLRNQRSSLPLRTVLKWGGDLSAALAYAHEEGFLHRDLKPDNILLTRHGTPVIADWGLGYFVHQTSRVLQPLTVAGMGTEYYCSREQWLTGKCGETGDVYSLGITLAEFARGEQVPLATEAVGSGITDDVVPVSSRGAAHFNSIIKRMTHPVPRRRIQTMEEVEVELRVAASLMRMRA